MKLFVALLFVVAVTAADIFEAKKLFIQFQQTYNKVYATEAEEQHRFQIFQENLVLAEHRNKEDTATHGVTQFMDLTPDEFKSQFTGFLPHLERQLATPAIGAGAARVNCVGKTQCNYAQLGAVTPVKNQGQCGSCWAFSTCEAVETAWFMAGNALPVLSPQQIVSCDTTDNGCNGGNPPNAYQYVIKAGGLETNAEYPYTATDSRCAFNAADIDASITTWSWGITPCNTPATYSCNSQNETGLYTVVQNIGPQSICVDAQPWQTYTGGIMNNPNCLHGYLDLDHCVQLTGYGTENTEQYWLVKNSWGVTWGEQGYIRLIYGKNMCGVADEVTFATGK
jgi:C1A family cysteine protease